MLGSEHEIGHLVQSGLFFYPAVAHQRGCTADVISLKAQFPAIPSGHGHRLAGGHSVFEELRRAMDSLGEVLAWPEESYGQRPGVWLQQLDDRLGVVCSIVHRLPPPGLLLIWGTLGIIPAVGPARLGSVRPLAGSEISGDHGRRSPPRGRFSGVAVGGEV